MAKAIPLTQGKVAIVDDEDHEWLNQYAWSCNPYGYAVSSVLEPDGIRRTKYMHRLIMQPPDEYNVGPSGRKYPKYLVDHIDGDTRNNQRSNLRICTHAESLQNRGKFASGIYSVYKGVYLDKQNSRNPWKVKIKRDKEYIHIGMFATELEAAIAYNNAAVKYHGEFARLNKLPSEEPEQPKPEIVVELISRPRRTRRTREQMAAIKYHGEFARLNELPSD